MCVFYFWYQLKGFCSHLSPYFIFPNIVKTNFYDSKCLKDTEESNWKLWLHFFCSFLGVQFSLTNTILDFAFLFYFALINLLWNSLKCPLRTVKHLLILFSRCSNSSDTLPVYFWSLFFLGCVCLLPTTLPEFSIFILHCRLLLCRQPSFWFSLYLHPKTFLLCFLLVPMCSEHLCFSWVPSI